MDLDVNSATAPTLGRLLTQGDAETRRAVSWGLGRARSQHALRLLAAALDDPDITVRHNAVMGLAKTTDQLTWSPSMDEFVNNQARYLDHWKEWSSSQR
jgi:HEAT repeat protein